MMRELYADNYNQQRLEALLRSEGRCENVIDGRRCPNRIGVLKVSHAHNIYCHLSVKIYRFTELLARYKITKQAINAAFLS